MDRRNRLPGALVVICMAAFSGCATGRALGQTLQPFQMVDPTRQTVAPPQGQVLNAAPAKPGDWPATFVFLTGKGSPCTSTAVGRRVVLTAAHCVADGQAGRVYFADGSVALTCNHHPDYRRDTSVDFALCLLDSEFPNLGIGFERISGNADLARSGQLLLLGYGCTTNTGERDFGSLYQGFADIAAPTAGKAYVHAVGGPAVCFGDSGGGAFWLENTANITGKRLLVGVNSLGDISKHSYISNTAVASFRDWAAQWASERTVAICGVQGAETNCRPS
jgi:secreted trypsin-like serine protease